MDRTVVGMLLVIGTSLAGLAALTAWAATNQVHGLTERVPGQTKVMNYVLPGRSEVPANPGTLIVGAGVPSALGGTWPGFRGPARDGVAHDAAGLLRAWPPEGPKVLWRTPVGEGYAGPAVRQGRVYLIDYDKERGEDAIRCLSLDDGREIWRYTYSVRVRPNHGMSRTVPAVNDEFVVTLGPKCHVTCLRAETGELVWKLDLVKDYGTTVPPWYAGQCPLLDGDVVILAPGGDPLMMAVELATGAIRWRTPNPGGHEMTHSSIVAVDAEGTGRQYVYCSSQAALGVAAADGRLLWTHPGWRVPTANVPTPVPVGADRVFLCGGYGSGSLMLQFIPGATNVQEAFRLTADVFGSQQHTPVLYDDHLYGVEPRGELVCLDLSGKRVWASGAQRRFGLGPFLVADGLLFIVDDASSVLHLVEASPVGYRELASAKVLHGHEPWAPMALVGGRLILRDVTEMVCIQVGGQP